MSETISHEEFSHYLHNDQNVLKGLKGETEDVTTDGKPNAVKEALQNDLQHLLDQIIGKVSPSGTPDPLAIMYSALTSLSEVEARRFVLQNLLEAIKGSGKVNVIETVRRYKDLGLTTIELDANLPKETADNEAYTKGFGRFILGLLKKVAKMALALMGIVVNALKVIPKFVGIKPSIGVVGGIPSLSFELEAEALSIAELFEALRTNN